MKNRSATSAANLMTTEMITVPSNASIHEVAQLLVNEKISGVPVRDEFSRIIGLLSLKDIARFEGERELWNGEEDSDWKDGDEHPVEDEHHPSRVPWGFHIETDEGSRVQHFMTPIVITVREDASIYDVGRTLLEKNVHRVLVTNAEGEIVGLISSLDLVRHFLAPDELQ